MKKLFAVTLVAILAVSAADWVLAQETTQPPVAVALPGHPLPKTVIIKLNNHHKKRTVKKVVTPVS